MTLEELKQLQKDYQYRLGYVNGFLSGLTYAENTICSEKNNAVGTLEAVREKAREIERQIGVINEQEKQISTD